MFNHLLASAIPMAGGLSSLKDTAISNWIGPIYLIVVAGIAIKLLIGQQMRALGIFVIIATIVGVLIFAGTQFFGSQDAILVKSAADVAKQVNTIGYSFPLLK